MSTLNDLRATLDAHAESIHDTETHLRAASVRRRARVVRRRRVVAVSVAAVVIVVAALAVGQWLTAPPEPVPAKQWHGVEVPGEVHLAAGTYVIDQIMDVRPGKKIEMPWPDDLHRQAVALVATGLGDGSATMSLNDGRYIEARLVGGAGVSPASALMPISLEVDLAGAPADAHVGVVFYDGPDTTYPERHYDDVLVASASEPEETTAEVTVDAALDKISLAPICDSADGTVDVSIDGEVVEPDLDCGSATQLVDGSFGTRSDFGKVGDPVQEHTIRVERSEPGVSIGVYVRGDGPQVLGQQVPETVEFHGRTWTLEKVIDQDEPGAPLTTSVTTGDEDRLVDFVNVGGARAKFSSTLSRPCRAFTTQDVSDFCSPVLVAGDTYDITVIGRVDDFQAAILVYRPV